MSSIDGSVRARAGPRHADPRPAAAPTAARLRAASIGSTGARITSSRRLRTRARSRPGTRAGTTRPIAARRPPRCARSGFAARSARERLERSPSDDARSRRRPSRRRATPTTSSRRLTPANGRSPLASRRPADADRACADGDRRQRVPHVVRAEQRHVERAERRAACAARRTTCPRRRRREVAAPASRRPSPRPNVSTGRPRASRQTRRASGLSAPSSSRPCRGTRFTSRAKRQPHRVEVRVDVGVVELDVVDHRDVGQVLQELRRLVEERAVVFVAFDDEVAPAARGDSSSRARRSCARCRRRARSDRGRPRSAASRSSDVVVVLPCVPAMTIERAPQRKCSRMASGSEQYRILRSSTSSSSGLPREIALPTTTRSRSRRDVLGRVAVEHAECLRAARKSLIGG